MKVDYFLKTNHTGLSIFVLGQCPVSLIVDALCEFCEGLGIEILVKLSDLARGPVRLAFALDARDLIGCALEYHKKSKKDVVKGLILKTIFVVQ